MSLKINMQNAAVIINGCSFTGRNVSIENGKITVDGNVRDGNVLSGPISVQVQGDCGWIECGKGDVKVDGNVRGDIKTGSGDVRCGDVGGSIQTGSGDVTGGRVGGGVRTGTGDITFTKGV